jgi:AcrR family transcriptional regulator
MSRDEDGPAQSARQDPRIERTRAHVLIHARQLLAEGGPDAVTYKELAARARVTRQTLYRHWPNREALFIDLARERAALDLSTNISDPPEHVIGEFLRAMRDGMDDASNTTPLAALIGKADHDPTCRNALIAVVGECRDLLNHLLEPSGVILDADQYARVCGPVLFQRFFAREPIRDQLIEQLIATWSADRTAAVTANTNR